jgi:hypothetical protein
MRDKLQNDDCTTDKPPPGGIDEVFAGFAMTAAAVTRAFFLLQKIQFDEVLGSCMHH